MSTTIFLGRPSCAVRKPPPFEPFPRRYLFVRRAGCKPDRRLELQCPVVPFTSWLVGRCWWGEIFDERARTHVEIEVRSSYRGSRHRILVWHSQADAAGVWGDRVLVCDRRADGQPPALIVGLPLSPAAAQKVEVA